MTNLQIIEAARKKPPYTSEFEHDIIRIPVSNISKTDSEILLLQMVAPATLYKAFYEVEFRKQYIKNIAIGWEFVHIY